MKRYSGGRYFFSPYPQHLNTKRIKGEDIKYGEFVKEEDKYAVSILMDGLHQHVGLREFLKLRRDLTADRYQLIDRFVRATDLMSGIYWVLRGQWYLIANRNRRYSFRNINVSEYVQKELFISFSRIARLMVVEKSLRRFFSHQAVDEFVFYLHEYPLGRLISYVLGTMSRKTLRIGFQHGPASWRKLVYFLAQGEGGLEPPFFHHTPIPDRVLAEDSVSAGIYEHSGYQDVRIMDRIYRLDYLIDLKPKKDPARILIVPGLHDGRILLGMMKPFIKNHVFLS